MSADPEDFTDDLIGPDDPVGPATQIGVICAILTYLSKTTTGHGIDLCTAVGIDAANAVLSAANLVMEELRKPGRDAVEDHCGEHMVSPDDADFTPPRRPQV